MALLLVSFVIILAWQCTIDVRHQDFPPQLLCLNALLTPIYVLGCFLSISLMNFSTQGWYLTWSVLNDRKVSGWQEEVGRHRPPPPHNPRRLRVWDEQDQELEVILLSPRESCVQPSPNHSTWVSSHFSGIFPWRVNRQVRHEYRSVPGRKMGRDINQCHFVCRC